MIHILIIEDNELHIRLFEMLILDRFQNVKLSFFLSGIPLFSDEVVDYDLIICDIQLPEISGIDILKEIRKKNPTVPVIAATAFAMRGDEERIMGAGFTDYIRKPVSVTKFIDVIMRQLPILGETTSGY